MAFREETGADDSRPADKYVPRFNKAIKELPSQGKAYPPKLEVRYRPYLFGEVKRINQSGHKAFSPRDRIMEILAGVQCSHGFDPLDLTLQDVLYIGFLRKRATFVKADQILIPHYCRACRKKANFLLRENQHLEFRDIKAPSLPIRFKMHGEEFAFQPLTVRRYMEYLDAGAQAAASDQEWDDSAAIMAAQCSSHGFEEAYKAVFNAAPDEAELIEAADDHLNHELMPLKLPCPNKKADGTVCGAENELKLDEVDRLVLPFRGGAEEPGAPGLHFGPGAAHQPPGRVQPGLPGGKAVRRPADRAPKPTS
jgi:hypothetical protein